MNTTPKNLRLSKKAAYQTIFSNFHKNGNVSLQARDPSTITYGCRKEQGMVDNQGGVAPSS